MRCEREAAVDAWARRGAGAPLGRGLSAHVDGCAVCGPRVAEIEQTRGWFADDVGDPSEERHDQIRFALMAAARGGAAEAPPAVASTGRRRLIAGGVAAGVAAAAAFALVFGGADAPAPVAQPVVELEAGARGHVAGGAPDMRYALQEGAATFRVPHLEQGQRYRVMAGDGVVEVRGTVFRVVVERDRLEAVSVSEGHVVVSLEGGVVADLRAGSSWSRPAPVVAAAEPVAPEPEVVELAEAGRPPTAAPVEPEPPRSRRAARAGRPAPARVASTLRPPPPEVAVTPPGAVEAEFAAAWGRFRAGDVDGAARAFDQLLTAAGLPGARRADVLYWSAEAHMRAGRTDVAAARARTLVEGYPGAWRAEDARRLLDRAGR